MAKTFEQSYDTIILGGGFGGLHSALKLKNSGQKVLLIDQNNYHLFIPLLYQVASAGLSSTQIATPFREILRDHKNCSVLMGTVEKILPDKNEIQVDGKNLSFKNLVVAIGDKQSYFGNDDWRKHTIGLKSLKDALKMRNQILSSYERAENSNDDKEIEHLLRFAIIGAGPTGVELAGALSEIAHETLVRDFRKIDPSKTEIYLLEASEDVLDFYSKETSQNALEQLENLGIKVKTRCMVKDIKEGEVVFQEGENGNEESLKCGNIFWAAGNEGHEIMKDLNSDLTKNKKAKVEEDLALKDYPHIFVIGDAAFKEQNGQPLPGQAPVAIQQGHYVAKQIKNKVSRENREPFYFFDKGSMATIGRSRAVGEIKGVRIKGTLAWLLWSVVHLYYLIQNRNRFFTFMNWVYRYISYERGARLIHHAFGHRSTVSLKKARESH